MLVRSALFVKGGQAFNTLASKTTRKCRSRRFGRGMAFVIGNELVPQTFRIVKRRFDGVFLLTDIDTGLTKRGAWRVV